MKEIELTKGKVALVDDEDFITISIYKWCAMFDGNNWYAYRTDGPRGKRKRIMMHRVILNITNNREVCDHKDGNGLNNTRINLRKCTTRDNSKNRRIKYNNSTGFKGVTFKRQHNKFQAAINVNGKFIFGGHFDTTVDAAKKYNEMAVIHHGEFAKLNVIPQ